MNFIVDCKIFPFDIMVHFGDKEDLKKNLDERLASGYDDFLEEGYYSARSFMLESGQTVLYMPMIPTDIIGLAMLQHEIFHCVTFIIGRLGIRYSNETDEIYAYLIQYVTKEIYEKLPITSFVV